MKVVVALLALCIVATVAQTARERAQEVVDKMTLHEKVDLLHGEVKTLYVGEVRTPERLGIPTIKMNDGPQGFRDDYGPGTTTAFPAMINLGATWDTELCSAFGEAMGTEFHEKGANVLLGPGMNLARVPKNGRVHEYVSGGDGYLGARMVKPIITAMQSKKVVANAKHWVNNNQETDRTTVSAEVSERTRFELYYEPFVAAVEAGVGSAMCSYNKIGGLWSCENPETLSDLKNDLGFDGWVMSDWGATHSTSINQGLDQEMPTGVYFGEKLIHDVKSGAVEESKLDESALRILTPMFELGLVDDHNDNDLHNDVRTPEHVTLARDIAAASQVLLQNEHNTLPLKKTQQKIAMIGQMARRPIVAGGGSGEVFPKVVISPYDGVMDHLGMADKVVPLSVNCTAPAKNYGFEQSSCVRINVENPEDCQERCKTYNGCLHWSFIPAENTRWKGTCLYAPTTMGLKPFPGASTGQCDKAEPEPEWQCNDEDVCVAVTDGSDLELAKKLAAEADVTVIAIGTSCGEGNDRETLTFARPAKQCQLEPEASQDDLVAAIAPLSNRSVVALTCPGACLTPWRSAVDAIVHGFLPGEAYGHGLADVLFGAVNPSGRLPLTMPNVDNEIGFTEEQWPGVDKIAHYDEEMLIDYRWYTAMGVAPAFSFGHGLSYSSFGYNQLVVAADGRSVTCEVSNLGPVAGQDVVQLYLTFPAEAQTPPLQLKGFVKTGMLEAGQKQTVSFTLHDRDLSVWDVSARAFRVVPGTFVAHVGASSTDLKLTSNFKVEA